jgi:predicted aspartyl protease
MDREASVLGAPSPPGPAAVVADESSAKEFSDEFWSAVADLDLPGSLKSARGEPEIRFAEGVALLAAGEYGRAETAFVATGAQLTDLPVAVASHTMLAIALMYQHKWAALADLSNTTQLAPVDRLNVAGLERWGRAFAGLDTQVVTFAPEPVSLPLRMTAIGTPTMRVRINGKEFEFWLDTGSSLSVLSSDVAREAGVSTVGLETMNVGTFAGVAPVRPVMVNRIEIGPMAIANSPAVVMDADLMRVKANTEGVPPGGTRVDGILGWDVIRRFDVYLDYQGRMITLRRPETLRTLGTPLQNLTWVGKPLVEIRAAVGGTMHFTLDTGSQTSFVNASIVKKIGVRTTSLFARVFGIGSSGAQADRTVPFMHVDVGGQSLVMRGLIVYAPTCSGILNCDGILGSDIGQFGTLRIDATNGIFSIG